MSAGPAAAHRPTVRRSPAQRAPRRVSGPARGRASTTRQAATVALPQSQPLAPRLADLLAGLPDARWLDRLMRGRAWIALIALGLIGLVFMQVSMLGMNAGIGQKVERASTLERSIADERAAVSALSSPERIQREAAAMGMVQPKPGDVSFLRSRGAAADARAAARTMTAPDADAQAQAAASALAAGSTDAATTGALPPTDAAQQAQVEEQQTASTVPGAQAEAQTQQQAAPQPQAAPTQQAQPQQAAATQPQTPAPQPQAATPQTPQATAQTQQQQPQATGATAAPGQ